ncbi:MAG: maleylpyruvate isomerase N-terminal domain-containing protein [Pseudonocardiaceae bacterium]
MRPDIVLAWVANGQVLLEQAVAGLDDLHGPSRLPGWTRGHVVTHLARNAEGLTRLLTWAQTGVEAPMYPSVQAREADIEAGAGRPLADQLNDLRRTGAAFAARAAQLSAQQWQVVVRNMQNPPVPAWQVPWMRVREVWLHLVDLDAGAELDVLPEDVATALVRDVAGEHGARMPVPVTLWIPGGEQIGFGPADGSPRVVCGPVQELAGWLTGRSTGAGLAAPEGLPELPPWR